MLKYVLRCRVRWCCDQLEGCRRLSGCLPEAFDRAGFRYAVSVLLPLKGRVKDFSMIDDSGTDNRKSYDPLRARDSSKYRFTPG